MTTQGYWLIAAHQYLATDVIPSARIPDSEHYYRLRFEDSDCPIYGEGKTVEEAAEDFGYRLKHYRVNDPELVPPLQTFENPPEKKITSFEYYFFADKEELKAA